MTLKDLSNYVLLSEQNLSDKIKSHSRNWLIAFGLAVILIIVLFVTVFKHKALTNDAYENQINALDSVVRYQQKTIESLQRFNAQQDSTIRNLNEAYKNNRPVETRIITKYEKVPIDVRGLDKSALRNEVSNFGQ